MSSLSFVYLDGSPHIKSRNKKIVRAHIAKHYHPHRLALKANKNKQLKRIAPHKVHTSESTCVCAEHGPIAAPRVEGQSHASQDVNISNAVHATESMPTAGQNTMGLNYVLSEMGPNDQIFQLEDGQIETRIDSAAVIGFSESGEPKNNGPRMGSLREEKDSTLVQFSCPGCSMPLIMNREPGNTQGQTLVYGVKELDSEISSRTEVDGIPFIRSLGVLTRNPTSPHARALVEKYASTVDTGAKNRGILPKKLPLRSDYMRAARNDGTLWRASVSFSSAMTQLFRGQPLDPVSLKYKGEAINAINVTLKDPSRQATDETIAAVQALASIECICGNVLAFKLHLQGMQEMVRLRGGLENLGYNGLLSRLIQMHEWRWELVAPDFHESISFSSIRQEPLQEIPPNLQMFTLGTYERKSSRPTKSLFTLLAHLQKVARAWDMQASFPNSSTSKSFVIGCSYLENQISALTPQNKPKEFWTSDDYEFESLRLACLIYSSNGTETAQTRLDRRLKRLQELQELLIHTDIAKYWTDIPGALIWCLAVAINEARELSEYSWFMAHLMPMLMMLAMECWNDLKRSLGIFSWMFKCCRNREVVIRS